MSAHYLIDQFGDITTITPWGVGTANILDAIEVSPGDNSPLHGNFVVRVPEGLSVQKPIDLGDLLTKKYLAFLAYYASFTRIAYDALLDATYLDLSVLGTSGTFGERSTIRLNPGSLLRSLPVGLVGSAPHQALITWETFLVMRDDQTTLDPKNVVSQWYEEIPPDAVTVRVSFNGGASWLTALDGMVLNIPPAHRGTSFLIEFTSVSGDQIRLGSWALIY